MSSRSDTDVPARSLAATFGGDLFEASFRDFHDRLVLQLGHLNIDSVLECCVPLKALAILPKPIQ